MVMSDDEAPAHAVSKMQPVSTRKATPKTRSFLRLGWFHPAPQRNNPGISRASATRLDPRLADEAIVV